MKRYSLIAQFISLIALVISLIFSLINNKYSYTYIVMGNVLMITAYNNQVFYKRKYMTVIYVIAGLAVIVMGVLDAIRH